MEFREEALLEEIESMKANHEYEINNIHESYERQIDDMQSRLDDLQDQLSERW